MPRIKNEDIQRAEYILGKDQVATIKRLAGFTKNSESGVLRRIIDRYFRNKTDKQIESKLGY